MIAEHGSLDILINNAGITIDKTVLNLNDSDWDKVLAVNLSGAFFLSQAALAHMIERGTGRIVNVSSIIGEVGNIGQANYAASKSGLFGLTKTLAKEAAFMLQKAGKLHDNPIGITVNTVTPGFVETEMLGTVPEKVIKRITDQIPVRRFARAGGDRPGGAFPGLRRRPATSPVRCGASTAGWTCSQPTGRRRRTGTECGAGACATAGTTASDGAPRQIAGAGCEAASWSSSTVALPSRSRSSCESAASCCSSHSSLARTYSDIRWPPSGVICTSTCRPSRGFSSALHQVERLESGQHPGDRRRPHLLLGRQIPGGERTLAPDHGQAPTAG